MAVRRPLPRALLRQELARIREALDAGDIDQALHLAGEVVRLAAPAGETRDPDGAGPDAADRAPTTSPTTAASSSPATPASR